MFNSNQVTREKSSFPRKTPGERTIPPRGYASRLLRVARGEKLATVRSGSKDINGAAQTGGIRIGLTLLLMISAALAVAAQRIAPGAPGNDAQWATAGKQGIGTSAGLESKVWFTLAQGVMTEVYYPDVTVANVHLLQFIVVDPRSKRVETEQDDSVHQVRLLRTDSPSYQQTNTARSGRWKIVKTYATDPGSNTVLIDVRFETRDPNLRLYFHYDPSIGNSGMKDKGYGPLLQLSGEYEYEKTSITNDGAKTDRKAGSATVSSGFAAEDGNIASALYFTSDVEEWNIGYLGTSDGIDQLRKFGKIRDSYGEATNGNVVEIGRIMNPKRFTVLLGFGADVLKASTAAAASLRKGFDKCLAEYEKGWADYVAKLPRVDPKHQAQFNMAAMMLKAHEDKSVRGANIASLTVPWGGGANANENNIGGYHLIWSRDLYQVATAFMAIGDRDAAVRAVNFLFKVQQKPDGSFPQNSFLDGRPFWGSLQMDEVAYPLVLAHELGMFDTETWLEDVKPAADFIVKNGPSTPQERWEEESGYSPSTIAAEIAGLVCAAEIARRNGDKASAETYLKTADDWVANIERWTVTKNGKYSKEPYYVRITGRGMPDAGDKIELNNGAGFFDEREIVDAGFLELVRLGIKRADDPVILNSIKVVDQVIRVRTPNGDGFYRYNNDGYGEMDDGRRWNWDGKYTGKGRLWALLSGERGQFELALQSRSANPKARLDAMARFANDGLMIPEQIWDKPQTPRKIDKQFVPELRFGEGTGSATPLAWSMAQFIRLAVNIKEGRNLDTPKVVYDRYAGRPRPTAKVVSDPGSIDRCLEEIAAARGIRQDFVVKVESSPVTGRCNGQSVAVFIHRGEARNVQIAGDFTGWAPDQAAMADMGAGRNTKALIVEFAPAARVEYKLIVDGKWVNDPLNPNKIDNGVGSENSFFAMPDYRPSKWADATGMTKDPIYVETVKSEVYGERQFKVYVPEGFDRIPLPVMYVNDGSEYLDRAAAVTVQRNLVKAGKVKPFIMVFLDPKERMKEYWANDDYAGFLAEEVVPAIDSRYRTVRNRDGRALFGASLGGITSVHAALKYPAVFGRIGAQSVSWWVDDERVVKDIERLDGKVPFRIYIDDGTLEGVEDSRRAVALLRKRGYPVTYVEAEAGHNWTAWRDRLAYAFVVLAN